MEHALYFLWTTGNPVTAKNMVLMYAHNALLMNWWHEVTLIVWGASTKLIAEDMEIQTMLSKMIQDGIKISACKACADELGVSEILEDIGIEIKYWGHPLSELIQNNNHLVVV